MSLFQEKGDLEIKTKSFMIYTNSVNSFLFYFRMEKFFFLDMWFVFTL